MLPKNYFKPQELECHCGCHSQGVTPEALLRLNALRSLVGMPFILTSAYRCSKHPVEAKKAKAGYHNKGIAFDIAITSGKLRARILKYAGILGFTAYGLSDEFIHLDLRGEYASWTY